MTLEQLVLRYVRERRSAGYLGPKTAENVRRCLSTFAAVAPDDPAKVRPRHVDKGLAVDNGRQPAPSYQRMRLSTLRCFMRWAVARRLVPSDPTLLIEPPRVIEPPPRRLRPEEARRLRRYVAHDLRLSLIVSLSLQEGLRPVEVSRALIEDLDLNEHTLNVRGKGGRGAITDVHPLTAETWSVLGRYLAETGNRRHGPIVVTLADYSNTARGIESGTVSHVVRRAMTECGIREPGDRSKVPYSLRHTCAHDLLAGSGGNVRGVQKGLRHRSVISTEKYLRGDVTDVRAILDGRTYDTDPESEAS